jgi:hypothetical protein
MKYTEYYSITTWSIYNMQGYITTRIHFCHAHTFPFIILFCGHMFRLFWAIFRLYRCHAWSKTICETIHKITTQKTTTLNHNWCRETWLQLYHIWESWSAVLQMYAWRQKNSLFLCSIFSSSMVAYLLQLPTSTPLEKQSEISVMWIWYHISACQNYSS